MLSARSGTLLTAVTCLGALVGPPPATAATPDSRSVVSTHLSVSGFDDKVPVGSVVSVVQSCPAGSVLDKVETRSSNQEDDGEPNVRLLGRELWVAGFVARYRVVARGGVPAEDGFGVVNIAVCTSRVPASTRATSARASTDVRVWGPAPSGVRLYSFTGMTAHDAADGDEQPPFLLAMRAAGTTPSTGALPSAVRATQSVEDDGYGALVFTQGRLHRSVAPGRFASMRSSYTYTVDLTQRMSEPEPEPADG